MVRVRGLNVPPELARDFGHYVETRTYDDWTIIGRRRSGSGMATGKRPLIRGAFRDAVSCWLFQTDEQKADWYQQAQGSGMRYYNYFMHKTIPEFYRGNVPSWCTAVENGMLEFAAGYLWVDHFLDVSAWKPGDILRFELEATWSHFGRYEDEWIPGWYYYDEMQLQLQVTDNWDFPINVNFGIRGHDECGDWEEEIILEPDWGEAYYRYWGYFPNHVPVTLVYEVQIPDFFAWNPDMFGHFRLMIENDYGYYMTGVIPVAWITSYGLKHNGNSVLYVNWPDPPDEAPPPEIDRETIIPFTHDPYSRWGYDLPYCGA